MPTSWRQSAVVTGARTQLKRRSRTLVFFCIWAIYFPPLDSTAYAPRTSEQGAINAYADHGTLESHFLREKGWTQCFNCRRSSTTSGSLLQPAGQRNITINTWQLRVSNNDCRGYPLRLSQQVQICWHNMSLSPSSASRSAPTSRIDVADWPTVQHEAQNVAQKNVGMMMVE